MKGNSNSNNNSNSAASYSYVLVAAIATLATASVIAVLYATLSLSRKASNNGNDGIASSKDRSSDSVVKPEEKSVEQGKEEEVRVAFVGNSMLYFNDSPRFLSYISRGRIVEQDSCLRGGASLISILDKGNGMSTKFRTPNAAQIAGQNQHDANHDSNDNVTYDIGSPTVQGLLKSKKWDCVILNDYTQSPARAADREATIQVLKSRYAPLLQRQRRQQQQQQSNNTSDDAPIIPILLMTPAYRKPVKNSQDLGTVHDFTTKLKQGYDLYAEALAQALLPQQPLLPKVAPWGIAYQLIHDENYQFWYTKLFHTDDFHPSPHGTFLRDVILYCTIFDELPDEEFVFANNSDDNDDGTVGQLWEEAKCRVMQPAQDEPLPRPTRSEAEYLWDVARRVCFENEKQP